MLVGQKNHFEGMLTQVSAEINQNISLPTVLESVDQGDQYQVLETYFARAKGPFRRRARGRAVGLHKPQEVLSDNVSQASTRDWSRRHDFDRACPFFAVPGPLADSIESGIL